MTKPRGVNARGIYKYINNNKKHFDKINQIVEEQGGIKKTKKVKEKKAKKTKKSKKTSKKK